MLMKRKIQFLPFSLTLIVLNIFPVLAMGSPGGIDNTFIQQGPIDAPICAVVVDSQTNIWIGGRFFNVYGQRSAYLAVLNPDGTLNTNLSNNGLNASIGVVHSLDVDDVDNIYVAGAQGVARLNHIFNNNSWQNDAAFQANARNVVRRGESVAVSRGFGTGADTIYVAGSVDYTNGNNVEVFNVVALDSFGNVIPGFNFPVSQVSGPVSQVRYLRPCSCGVNTIGIPFLLFSGAFGVMLTDYTGLIYSSYSDGLLRSCAAMRNIGTSYFCPSPYGEVVSAGFFQASYFANGDTYSGFTLDRFGGTVPNWFHDIKSSHFPQDNGGGIAAVETFEGGDVVIAGNFTTIHGVNKPNFAHLWADGTVDTSFTDASDIPTFAMALQPDGKFILVGETTSSPFGGRMAQNGNEPVLSSRFHGSSLQPNSVSGRKQLLSTRHGRLAFTILVAWYKTMRHCRRRQTFSFASTTPRQTTSATIACAPKYFAVHLRMWTAKFTYLYWPRHLHHRMICSATHFCSQVLHPLEPATFAAPRWKRANRITRRIWLSFRFGGNGPRLSMAAFA